MLPQIIPCYIDHPALVLILSALMPSIPREFPISGALLLSANFSESEKRYCKKYTQDLLRCVDSPPFFSDLIYRLGKRRRTYGSNFYETASNLLGLS